ncbi:hypothetical protein GCM10010459_00080 [Microbacterium schleiferi]
MEYEYDLSAPELYEEFEYTPQNIALIRKLASQALEPGSVVVAEGPASDYIDSLLPA